MVDDKEIEEVAEYFYLGHLVNRSNSSQDEINRRKRTGCVAFSRIRASLLDEGLSTKAKRDLYNTTVIPTITYAAECWSTTKADEEGLQVTERAAECMLCNISGRNHVPRKEIRKRTEVKNVIQVVYDSKRR